MKSKRVWGYKLSFVKNGGGRKEYVRYTPMEFEVDGMRFWYETETDNNGKYFSVTHADSGIKAKTLRNCKVGEIAERLSENGAMVAKINERIADKEEKMLHESMQKMNDIMEYIKRFDSPNGFIKGKEGNYPPENIPYEAHFEMDWGELRMFVPEA